MTGAGPFLRGVVAASVLAGFFVALYAGVHTGEWTALTIMMPAMLILVGYALGASVVKKVLGDGN